MNNSINNLERYRQRAHKAAEDKSWDILIHLFRLSTQIKDSKVEDDRDVVHTLLIMWLFFTGLDMSLIYDVEERMWTDER